ncbi:MAG: efflux RND transporter periplasmic adaptor subunit [Myxococcota bacterium]
MSRRSAYAFASGAFLVAALGWVVFLLRDPSAAYITVPVERGSIEATVTAMGTLNPVRTVEVGTYVSGRIERIDVDFNSRVSKGQVIAKIDPATYTVKVHQARAKVATARARVERAKADLRLKQEQLRRQRSLLERTVVSRDDFEAAESSHAQALAQLGIDEAGLVQAEAGLEDARVNLSYTDIVSPVDGIVLSRDVNVGQTVAATYRTPTLFLIAHDLAEMQVNASVSESDIGNVREGQSARFEVDAYPGRVFEGEVKQVRNAPISVQNVVTYDVVIDVENPGFVLKPGMTARVTVTTDRREDALRVPLRALRFRLDGEERRPVGAGPRRGHKNSTLWLANGADGPRRVEVQTGIRDEERIEIVSGVRVGDDVIIGYEREP